MLRWILVIPFFLSFGCAIVTSLALASPKTMDKADQVIASPKTIAETYQALASIKTTDETNQVAVYPKMMVKTEFEFAQTLKDNNLKVVPDTLHFNYYYTTLDEWKKILDEAEVSKQHKLDVNDCVHHSLAYIVICNQHDLNAIGMVLGSYKGENHAFNIFYTDTGFYIWEGTISLNKQLMRLDEASQQGFTIGNILY